MTSHYPFCYIATGVKKPVLALRLIGVGFYIGFCIAGGVVLGLWLDGKFHTTFIFTIAGLFLGLTCAFVGVYQMLKPFLNDNSKGDD